MSELRLAANQKELVVAQRKLARYQRLADEKGILAQKVLTNVPEWVREDAMRQAEWVAAKKKARDDSICSVSLVRGYPPWYGSHHGRQRPRPDHGCACTLPAVRT